MKIFVRDKEFYKTLVTLTLPMTVQNLINVMVSLADTVMIGQLGEVQLSATSIANQLWFILMLFGFGLAGGANVLIAQYWGKRDVDVIKRVLSLTYKISMVMSLIFVAIALFWPRQFVSIYTTDEAVIEYGVQYLRTIGFSYPFYALANATVMMLRSVGAVNFSVVVYLSSLFVNVTLNYMLIFGNFGAPRLEVRGGAIATGIARLVEFSIAFGYLLFKEKNIRFRPKDLLLSSRNLYRKYVAIALPVIGNELMWGIGASLCSVVIGRISTGFVAANSVYTVVNQFVTVMIFGVGGATQTIVGNTIGSGKYELAKQRAVTLYALTLVLGIFSAIITLLLGPLVISFYNLSTETIAIARSLTHVGAIIVFFQAFSFVGMVGILRAGGDAKYVLICEMVLLWCVAIPLGFLTGLVLHWPAPIVFLFLKCDEIIKSSISTVRIFRFRWLRDITLSE